MAVPVVTPVTTPPPIPGPGVTVAIPAVELLQIPPGVLLNKNVRCPIHKLESPYMSRIIGVVITFTK